MTETPAPARPAAPARRHPRGPRGFGDGIGVRLAATVVLIFLVLPLVVLVISSFNPLNTVAFPPDGLSLRWYREVLTSPEWLVSIRLSLVVMLLAVPAVVLLGTLAAYGLYRGHGRGALAAFFMSPLIVPEVMLGLGMLTYLQRAGLINTVVGLWLVHCLVTFPFVVRTVSVSVQALDPMLERAGQSLGAGPLRVFWTITLPQLRPGIVAGAVFAGVLSLGEVAVSTFVSGPNTTTVPLRVLSSIQFELDPSSAAVSTLLMALSVVLMVVISRWVNLSSAF